MSERRKLHIDSLDIIKSSQSYIPAEYLNFSRKEQFKHFKHRTKVYWLHSIMSIKSFRLLNVRICCSSNENYLLVFQLRNLAHSKLLLTS